MNTEDMHRMVEATLHPYGCTCEICAPILERRNHAINPGGLIHFVGLSRDTVRARAERRQKQHDPSGHAGAVINNEHRDHRGFFFCDLRWHSVE